MKSNEQQLKQIVYNRHSGMSRVECYRFPNVSANTAVAIFRVNVYWNQSTNQQRANEGRILVQTQGVVHCQIKPFLRMKRRAELVNCAL
jgi:hypothetical protein